MPEYVRDTWRNGMKTQLASARVGDMTETQLGGNAASAITPGRLVLLRHGQTVWSESGQHTGRTNIPLTDIGCDQVRAAGERLREAFPQGFAQGCMFASPLRRAQQTAQLAGYGDFKVLPEIAEWDYGRAEGRTRQDVSAAGGFVWNVWRDGPRSLPRITGGRLGRDVAERRAGARAQRSG